MNYIQLLDCEEELKALKTAQNALRNCTAVSYRMGADMSFLANLDRSLRGLDARIREVESVESQLNSILEQQENRL